MGVCVPSHPCCNLSTGYWSGATRRAFCILVPRNHFLCRPSKKWAPTPSKDRSPKQSNRSSATGVHFGACAPPKCCLCPTSLSKVSFCDENTSERHNEDLDFATKTDFLVFTPEFKVKTMTKPRFQEEDLLFFVLHPCICGQRLRSAPLDPVALPPAKIVPIEAPKGGKMPGYTRRNLCVISVQ